MDSEKSKTTLNAALSNPRQDIAELDALEKKSLRSVTAPKN